MTKEEKFNIAFKETSTYPICADTIEELFEDNLESEIFGADFVIIDGILFERKI